MVVVLLVGLAWIAVYYIAGDKVPIMQDIGAWNFAVAFGIMLVGLVMAVRRGLPPSTPVPPYRAYTRGVHPHLGTNLWIIRLGRRPFASGPTVHLPHCSAVSPR